jgi:hypothetical protein
VLNRLQLSAANTSTILPITLEMPPVFAFHPTHNLTWEESQKPFFDATNAKPTGFE